MKLTHDKTNATTWPYYEVETALCLWEAVLEILNEKGDDSEKTEDAKLIANFWDGNGAFTMRAAVASMVTECGQAFEAIAALNGGDYDGSFDWDFCPQFVRGALKNGIFEQALGWQYKPADKIRERSDWQYPVAA
jgi:hypothetical protein